MSAYLKGPSRARSRQLAAHIGGGAGGLLQKHRVAARRRRSKSSMENVRGKRSVNQWYYFASSGPRSRSDRAREASGIVSDIFSGVRGEARKLERGGGMYENYVSVKEIIIVRARRCSSRRQSSRMNCQKSTGASNREIPIGTVSVLQSASWYFEECRILVWPASAASVASSLKVVRRAKLAAEGRQAAKRTDSSGGDLFYVCRQA